MVWIPKYQKDILDSDVKRYVQEVFRRIADEYEFSIKTMEVIEDHVHAFVEVPPQYLPAEAVQILKSISAQEVSKKFPRLRRQLWAGELWSDGYFVRSVGDKVTTEVIRRYIEYQTHAEDSLQLRMFKKPSDAPQLAEGLLTFGNLGCLLDHPGSNQISELISGLAQRLF